MAEKRRARISEQREVQVRGAETRTFVASLVTLWREANSPPELAAPSGYPCHTERLLHACAPESPGALVCLTATPFVMRLLSERRAGLTDGSDCKTGQEHRSPGDRRVRERVGAFEKWG